MRRYLKDLKDGQAFTLDLILVDKTPPKSTQGPSKMFTITVADKTGSIKAIFFGTDSDCNEFYNNLELQQVYTFCGIYNFQFNNFKILKGSVTPVLDPNMDDFNLVVEVNQIQSDKLFEYIDNIEDIHIKSLLKLIFEDKELLKKFLTHPAAVTHHHSFGTGLITHVLEMLQIAESISSIYPKLNRDLLYCGCILHDIGKTTELTIQFGTIYSDEGRLLSHIPIGYALTFEAIAKIDGFPRELTVQILHMILSHHGKPSTDIPSPVKPQTLEAAVLHHIDMISSQISPIHDFINKYSGWNKFSKDEYLLP